MTEQHFRPEGDHMLDDPAAAIEGIKHEMRVMGANDDEIDALSRIIDRLRAGTCTVDEALAEAKTIRNSKQDYH